MEKRFHKTIKSPVGELTLIADDEALLAVLWENDHPDRVEVGVTVYSQKHPILVKTETQLIEYFSGKRKVFDLRLKFHGTEFQNKVWSALQRIPFGETRSYAELAREIGSPKACRAVGTSNGRNPLSIVVPCHRVIGTNGKLTGFAGGLKIKGKLLQLEGVL